MTAPVASLSMTPPEMGGQGAAPAIGATAGSDSAFEALVSAFFESAEVTLPTGQTSPQAPSAPLQSPQAPVTVTQPSIEPGTPVLAAAVLKPPQSAPIRAAEAPLEPNPDSTTPLAKDNRTNGDASQQMSAPAAAPTSEDQTVNIDEPAQIPLENAAASKHSQTPEKTPSLPVCFPDSSVAQAVPSSNVPQNETAAAPSAGSTQTSSNAAASIPHLSETPINGSARATIIAEPNDDAPVPDALPAVVLGSRPSRTERQEKAVSADKRLEEPVVDISLLSEMAPPVAAQFLAAQPQPPASHAPIDAESVIAPASDKPDSSALADENLAAQDAPAATQPLPPVAHDLVAQAPLPETASSAPVEALSPTEEPRTLEPSAADVPVKAAPAHSGPTAPASDASAQTVAAEPQDKTSLPVGEPHKQRLGSNPGDTPKIALSTDQINAEPRKPVEPTANYGTTQDAGAATNANLAAQIANLSDSGNSRSSAEPASPRPDRIATQTEAAPAQTSGSVPLKTAATHGSDRSGEAAEPDSDRIPAQPAKIPTPADRPATAGKTDSSDAADTPVAAATDTGPTNPGPKAHAALSNAPADFASSDDRPDQPSVSNSPDIPNPPVETAETASANAAARTAPVAPVTLPVAAETVSPDVQSRPAIAPRAARGAIRAPSGDNGGPAETANQSAKPEQPESGLTTEKSATVSLAELVQDRDAPKSASKPASEHSIDSAAAPDAPETDKPANLTPPVEPAQPQTARAEAPANPAAAQPQPAAIDSVAPNAAAPHGFDVHPAHAAAPRELDTPVKLAFVAPNVPDRSAFDALALKIASHSSGGDNHFSIRLDPAELGKIEVNLSVDAHGHAQAELSADKPQTLELLQKDASALERALRDAGLNLSGGLAFSLKGDGRSQAWRDSQGGRSRGLQIAAADAASANAALSARAALAAQAYGLPTSHLDIRV